MTNERHVAFVGLGSNLGDSPAALDQACRVMGALAKTCLAAVSRRYVTQAIGGPPDQPDYLNAVAQLVTGLGPEDLLDALQGIESATGRRRTVRWGPRSLDLDLLLFDDLVLQTDRLTLPHPLLAERRFVLEPLAEIAPRLRHPQLGMPIAELADRLRQGAGRRQRVSLLQEVPA